MLKRRKYNPDYVRFGITCYIDEDGCDRPQCIICGKVLCNDSLRPNKLNEHFTKMHPKNATDSLEILKKLEAYFLSSRAATIARTPSKKPLVEASYRVALQIAKSKKPYTIAESLIKPCAIEMVKSVIGEEQSKRISDIPMSNDIIRGRIKDMSNNILQQLLAEMTSSNLPFSLQIEETTDEAKYSHLLIFIRYPTKSCIKEDFLHCESLSSTATGAQVYQIIDNFFTALEFKWKERIGFLCTEGTSPILGENSEFKNLMRQGSPNVVITHCYPHQYTLACKTLPVKLRLVLDNVLLVVNFFKSHAPHHRLIKALCRELGSEYDSLFYQTNSRWLSHGKLLSHVFELYNEISKVLSDKKSKLYDNFISKEFYYSLAYLSDIFSYLNDLNCSVRGPGITLLNADEKITAFKNKLSLWKNRFYNKSYANFPLLESIIMAGNFDANLFEESISGEVISHLDEISKTFIVYFSPSDFNKLQWVHNPFTFDINEMDDMAIEKENFIDMKGEAFLKHSFSNEPLDSFWCSLLHKYPSLASKALLILIPFATTYLCDSGLITLILLKDKSRNLMHPGIDMRLALSKTQPNIPEIALNKQEHRSH